MSQLFNQSVKRAGAASKRAGAELKVRAPQT